MVPRIPIIAIALWLASSIVCDPATSETQGDTVEILAVRDGMYMLAGAGANVGLQIGSDGIVVVDTGTEATADKILAAIQQITKAPIRYIINTNADEDHVGGNGKLAQAGQTIFVNPVGGPGVDTATLGGASILAHESILRGMSAPAGSVPAFSADNWPTEAFSSQRKYMRMNNEVIEVFYESSAHSSADSFVFFRKSDVVAAGDVLDTTGFPNIDISKGGSVQGEILALNRLIALAIPAGPFLYQNDVTYVIPGHGRLCEQQDVVDYRDMVVIIRDNIAEMIKQGLTPSQIIAAGPAKGYETQFGRSSRGWTTNAFVEAVYKSLTKDSEAVH